jgi:hypothetical protein
VGTPVAERRLMARHHFFWLTSSTLALILATACSGDDANPATGGGGQTGSGGGKSDGGSSSATGGKAGSNGTGGASTGGAGDGGPGSGGASTADGAAGSSTGGAPATGGTASTGGSAGAGGASTGGAAGAGGAGDAAAACNAITNDGSDVGEQAMTGSPPAMTGGGPIGDGTYVLIQRQDWQGSCNCRHRTTISVSGNQIQFVSNNDGGPDQRLSATMTYSGSQVTFQFTCGDAQFLGASMTMQYTYSPGAGSQAILKTYDTNGGKSQVETYMRVPPGGCTTLTSTQPVTSQAGTGNYPTPAGGTIADGTYLLSKYEIWPPGNAAGVTRRSAFRVTGSQIETFELNETSGFSVKGTANYTTSGSNITFTYTCPAGGGYTKPYTATANEFIWFETNASDKFELWTYTKQ